LNHHFMRLFDLTRKYNHLSESKNNEMDKYQIYERMREWNTDDEEFIIFGKNTQLDAN